MNKKTWSIIGIIAVVLIALVIWDKGRGGELDAFAQCLGDEGATFYGAFWCPHCQDQKKLFGRSEKNLPYLECSTPDGRAMTQECQELGIQGYPTWEFADGSRQSGVLSLSQLSEATGCNL